MRIGLKLAIVVTAVCLLAATASAQTEKPASPAGAAEVKTTSVGTGLGVVGLCVGAALAVLGGGMAIGSIGSRATESIARQPEAAGSMFLAWLLPAAMVEGGMLFAVLVCFMAMDLLK